MEYRCSPWKEFTGGSTFNFDQRSLQFEPLKNLTPIEHAVGVDTFVTKRFVHVCTFG